MSEPRSFMALDWVKGEIEETLDRAREALEAYAEAPEDITLARQCLTSLHQVHGTLQMVELTGAATLASEMEALAQALMNRSVTDEERAQEALMEGILQLPAHLNRVHRGGEDDARVHALLMDRMRVARGEAPQADASELAADPAAIAEFLAGSGPLEVRKVRAAFQKAMVALLKGAQPPEKMYQFFDKAFSRLAKLTPSSPLERLWALAAGAMEVRTATGEDPKTVLPLLRGLDQQLKDLAESTEAALVADAPAPLREGLAAIVAGSEIASARLDALREQLAGPDAAPASQPIGADDDTIAMVATALHEELENIRDRLDLFVRGNVSDAEGLASLGEDLQKVAGTLQVTGLDELRETIARQAAWIRQQADAPSIDEDAIMEVASAVLFVDSTLMAMAGIESDGGDGMPGSLSDAQTAVLREARTSLESVKQGIVDFIASDWEHGQLEAVPSTLIGVKSVLELVPLKEAAALIEAARSYVADQILTPLAVPEWQRLDNLADAITSIDYYLERLIEDRVIPDPRLLEIANESIEALGAEVTPTDLNATYGDDAAIAPAQVAEPAAPEAPLPEEPTLDDDAPADADTSGSVGAPADDDAPSSVSAPTERGFDLESTGLRPIVDAASLPDEDLDATGVRAPDDMPELVVADDDLEETGIRAPEDAPTIERLDDAGGAAAPAEPSDADFDLGLDAEPVADASPADEPGLSLEPMQADASPEAAVPAEPEPAPAASAEPAAAADDDLIDDDILEIFLEEVDEVLENIDGSLPAWRANPGDTDALGEIRRAYHTLKGSGRMVGALVIGELAWSVENMLNRVIDGTIDASGAVIDLVADVRGLVPELRAAFGEKREPTIDVAPYSERADLLASGGTADELPPIPASGDAAPTPAAETPAEAIEAEAAVADAPATAAADDEPSGLSAPTEDDFDLGDDLGDALDDGSGDALDDVADLAADVGGEADLSLDDLAEPLAEEGQAASTDAPSMDASGDDAPSSLTAPVEDDFDLDLGLDSAGGDLDADLSAEAVEPDAASLEPTVAEDLSADATPPAPGEDAPSSLTAPVEDDFDLDLGLDASGGDLDAGLDADLPAEAVEPDAASPELPVAADVVADATPTAPGEDAPSTLTAPVEDDFDLDLDASEGDLDVDADLSADPVEPDAASPEPTAAEGFAADATPAAPGEDAPSSLTAPVEDDFDADAVLDLDGIGDDLAADEPAVLDAAPAETDPPQTDAPDTSVGDVAATAALGAAAGVAAGAVAGAMTDEDAPSPLSAPTEDDFDLGAEGSDAFVAEEPEPAEPSLFEIFEAEAEEHLETIRRFVAEVHERGPGVRLSEALRRSLHTLKGSAAMAEFPGISELAAPLEQIVRAQLDLRRNADAALAEVVEEGMRRIEAGLEHLRQSGNERVFDDAEQGYLERAQTLLARLQQELREHGTGEEKPTARGLFAAENVDLLLDAASIVRDWASKGVDARLDALRAELKATTLRAREVGQGRIASLSEALDEAHDRLGDVLGGEAQRVLENAHERLVGTFDALAAELDVPPVDDAIAELASVAPVPGMPEPVVEAPPALPVVEETDLPEVIEESVAGLDLDPEMVEIFFEEADEILESIEGALDAWPAGDESAADELLRALHTLKGGARMAGLMGLGGEAHDLETWIGEGRGNADAAFHTTLRERADTLAEHVAALKRGEAIRIGGDADAPAAPAAEAAPAEVQAPDPVVEPPVVEPAAPAETPPAVSEAADPVAPTLPAAMDDDLEDADPEIVALFLEEASELTEMLDGSLQGWRDEPANEIHRESVLRALHTLKGGARMAGLMGLGERVHELETRIIETRGEADAGYLAGVQSESDAIAAAIAALGGDTPAETEAAPEPTPEADAPAEAVAPAPVETTPVVAEAVPEPEAAPAEPEAAPAPAPAPAAAQGAASKEAPQEMIRVSAGLLEELVNLAGETSIMRGRVQQQISDFGVALDELSATIERIGEQIRRLDSEAQEQLLSKQEAQDRAEREGYEDFDPLEMDRYTQLQELTRTLAESASDIGDLRDTLAERLRDADTLLVQQGRINTELQEGLMRTRMVPFARLLPRLKRIVRQVGRELGKPVDLMVENAEGELDRNVLERMIAPLEHMLRNAVDHGLEDPETRAERGKPPQGTIRLRLDREGGDILIHVADDGGGINVAGVRAKAVERGLLEPDADVGESEILSFIMSAGFSTAKSVTQISGRGVGMDVVNSEVKELGGSIAIASTLGEGTTFTVRLPFTVSVNRALMVTVGNDTFAVPLGGIEGIVRVSPMQLIRKYEAGDGASFSYAGRNYELSYLGEWLGDPRRVRDDVPSIPIIMVRSGDIARAVHVDAISGSREIVVKSLGAQFAGVGGISGATIMGDGSVVVILDLAAVLRADSIEGRIEGGEVEAGPKHVMVVDDSVTVRKVTTRLLERKGYRVSVAKDGVEAVAALTEEVPDVMLLDIEMPRMDGFEVATHVRNEAALAQLPIIMITSRTGDKHRERAEAIGVNRFLGKPFQEPELLETIEALTS